MPPLDDRFDSHSVPAADANNQTASLKADQALELLQREARIHQQQRDETGLIGRAVASVTEFWHGSDKTGAQVDDLRRKIQADVVAGKTGEAASLAGGAGQVVEADQAALKTRGEIAGFGSGAVQAAGLFMAGRRGFVVAGAAAALDAIKPGSKESVGEQIADLGLGVGRAMALKGAFVGAGKINLGMAETAVGLGVSNRVMDLAMNRKTYLDEKTGKYSADLGGERIWAGATDRVALGTDIASFALARGALGTLSGSAEGAIAANRALSTTTVGGIFGMSQGAVSEAVRQHNQGVFEPGQLIERTLTSGLSSMAGAAIGGKFGMRPLLSESSSVAAPAAEVGAAMKSGPNQESGLARKSSLAPEISGTAREVSGLVREVSGTAREISGSLSGRLAAAGLNVGDAKPNFVGSTTREYQLVEPNQDVASKMASSKRNFVMTQVLEIGPDGRVISEPKNLLIHHAGDGIPVDPALAGKVDAVASCNPDLLPPALRSKHIMQSVKETLWLSQGKGGRLKFSDQLKQMFSPGERQPVPLGNKSVSELLQEPDVLDKIYAKPNPHALSLYSEVLDGYKIPGKKVLIGGADSLVVELADNSILKISPKSWNSEWGFRTFRNAQGKLEEFDAQLLDAPKTVETPWGSVTYYRQERAQTDKPVTESGVMIFADRLAQGSSYNFWDRDPTQLGIVMRDGKPVVRLLDYDAVRPLHLVPKDMKPAAQDRFERVDRRLRRLRGETEERPWWDR